MEAKYLVWGYKLTIWNVIILRLLECHINFICVDVSNDKSFGVIEEKILLEVFNILFPCTQLKSVSVDIIV